MADERTWKDFNRKTGRIEDKDVNAIENNIEYLKENPTTIGTYSGDLKLGKYLVIDEFTKTIKLRPDLETYLDEVLAEANKPKITIALNKTNIVPGENTVVISYTITNYAAVESLKLWVDGSEQGGLPVPIAAEGSVSFSKDYISNTSFQLKGKTTDNINIESNIKTLTVAYPYFYGNLSTTTFTSEDLLDTAKFTSITGWPSEGLFCNIVNTKYLFWVTPESYSYYQIGNAPFQQELEDIPAFTINLYGKKYYVYSPNWNNDTNDYTLFNDSDYYKLIK